MLLLLLLGPCLAVHSLRLKSATFDEAHKLVSGLDMLATGDRSVPVDHPPLARLLGAFAVETADLEVNLGAGHPWTPSIQVERAQALLYRANDADRLLDRARLAFVPLLPLLGLAIYGEARRLWGARGALISLTLCALSPSLLAHGRLVGNDLLIATFGFIAMAAAERATRRLSIAPVLLSGVALGLALASKHSALLGALVLAGGILLRAARPGPWVLAVPGFGAREIEARHRWPAALATLACIALISGTVLWSFYDFRQASWSVDDPAAEAKARVVAEYREGHPVEGVPGLALRLAEASHLLPEPYVLGIRHTFSRFHRLSYFMGERSIEGHLAYFPVAFAIKTPLGTLALAALAGLSLLCSPAHRRRLGWSGAYFLLLFPALYVLSAISSRMNVGHRHLLPIYPFLFLMIGAVGPLLRQRAGLLRKGLGLVVAGGLAASIGASLWIHPDPLAFFNRLAGGPRGGIAYLGGSNLDWGQDLRRLGPWMEEHGVDHVKLGYFGIALPEYYGFSFERMQGNGFANTQVGTREIHEGDVLAVSATCRQGFFFQRMDTYDFLEDFEPIDVIGHSLYLYRIDPALLRDPPPERESRPAPERGDGR